MAFDKDSKSRDFVCVGGGGGGLGLESGERVKQNVKLQTRAITEFMNTVTIYISKQKDH